MNIIKIAIIGGVIALAWFMFSSKSYDPIPFSTDLYEAVSSDHSNKVINIFYTPNGVDPNTSPKLLHISSVRHNDNAESDLKRYRQEMKRVYSLKPAGKSENRYTGKLKNRKIYFLEKNKAFIIYFPSEASVNSEILSRKEQAEQTLDAMDRIPLFHLKTK